MGANNTKQKKKVNTMKVIEQGNNGRFEELIEYTEEGNNKTNKFKADDNSVVNKSPGDPGYSWHHHTKEGRKVLSGLNDEFDMYN